MTVPIILNGRESGALELRRDGPFTLFEARCERQEGLTRLWVFGGGRRGYLGVMQPENGGLTLRRRLSRAAMRTFPDRIEYAGAESDAGRTAAKKTATAREREGNGWTERPDGSLVRTDGKERWIALPCALRRDVRGTRVLSIGGRTFLVFRC